MLYEERLIREILADAPQGEPYEVELFDERQCDAIERILRLWGCRVERSINRARITVWPNEACTLGMLTGTG